MSGKIINGVDVDVVVGLIKAVKEQPTLANSKFRANNEWIEGGGTVVLPSKAFTVPVRRFRIPNHLSWMQTNPPSWRDKI